MKFKIVSFWLLFLCSAAIYAQTIWTPDGKIVVCRPAPNGTLVCM